MATSDHRHLIAKIAAAQDAEARARRHVSKMGRHVVELLTRARDVGISDTALARALLRRRHGKVTLALKRREVERLRKRRRRGTACPDLSTAHGMQPATQSVPSMSEVPNMSKLIKRKITEETFAPNDDAEDLELAGDQPEDEEDDLDGGDDDEGEAA